MYMVTLHQIDMALRFKLEEPKIMPASAVSRGEIVHKKMTQSCYNLPLHSLEIQERNRCDLTDILSVT